MGLFRAVKQLVETANSPPLTLDPDDAEAIRHSRYHRRIVLVGCGFAILGVMVGLFTSAVVASDVKSAKDVKGLFLVPVMYGAGGFVFGMALTCLVAPGSFLTGPFGGPWMKLIGTRNVAFARVVCLLFGLLVTAPVVGVGLQIAHGIL